MLYQIKILITNLEKICSLPLTPIDSLRFLYVRAPVDFNSKHCSVLVPSFLLLPATPAFMRAPAELRGGSGGANRSKLFLRHIYTDNSKTKKCCTFWQGSLWPCWGEERHGSRVRKTGRPLVKKFVATTVLIAIQGAATEREKGSARERERERKSYSIP